MLDENQNKQKPEETSTTQRIITFFWSLVTVFAIFLCFKCNDEFSIGDFLFACCCSPFYVAYKLATTNCIGNLFGMGNGDGDGDGEDFGDE